MRAKPHGHKVSLDTLKKLAVQPYDHCFPFELPAKSRFMLSRAGAVAVLGWTGGS